VTLKMVKKQATQHKLFKGTMCPFTGVNCRKDCELYVYIDEDKQGCVFRALLDISNSLRGISLSLAAKRGL